MVRPPISRCHYDRKEKGSEAAVEARKSSLGYSLLRQRKNKIFAMAKTHSSPRHFIGCPMRRALTGKGRKYETSFLQ